MGEGSDTRKKIAWYISSMRRHETTREKSLGDRNTKSLLFFGQRELEGGWRWRRQRQFFPPLSFICQLKFLQRLIKVFLFLFLSFILCLLSRWKKVSFSNYILCYPTQHSFFMYWKLRYDEFIKFSNYLELPPHQILYSASSSFRSIDSSMWYLRREKKPPAFCSRYSISAANTQKKMNIILEIISNRARQTTKQQLTIKIEITKFDIDV